MARAFYVAGEVLVKVRNAAIGTQELGLSDSSIVITPTFKSMDIAVDTWGSTKGPPPEIQSFLAEASVSMTLVHFDQSVLNSCIAQSMAASTAGTLSHAGTLMGGNAALQASGNYYIQLGLSAPIGGQPWTFFACKLEGNYSYPVGTERSVVRLNWRVIPYPPGGDPWNGGQGANGVVLWNYSSF